MALLILAGALAVGLLVSGGRRLTAPQPAAGTPLGPVPRAPARLVDGEVAPAAGVFLIADRDLQDPNFTHSVVLLLEYGEEGAVGLIVNRPSGVLLARVLPQIEGFRGRSDTVSIGGPVERLRVIFLFRAAVPPEESAQIFGEVCAASSLELLRGLVERGEEVRVYSGYSGWGPGQLEVEISRGDWHLLPGEAAAVFAPDPAVLWEELLRRSELRVVSL